MDGVVVLSLRAVSPTSAYLWKCAGEPPRPGRHASSTVVPLSPTVGSLRSEEPSSGYIVLSVRELQP